MDLTALLPRRGRSGEGPLVLELDCDRGVVTGPPASPLQALRSRNAISIGALRESLDAAATDPQVAGLAVHLGTCPLPIAVADEVGDLLGEFGRHKPVIAWTETFGELDSGLVAYRLAVRAGEIWVQPSGILGFVGVHLDIRLLRGTLDKLGVEPQFARRKEYKSAGEQFTDREVSAPNREMMQRIADSVVDDTVALVARERNLDVDAVRHAIDTGPLGPDDAVKAGLIDRIGYRDEVYAALRLRFGLAATEAPGAAPPFRYVQRYPDPARRQLRRLSERNRPAVAVVDIEGNIVRGAGQPGPGRLAASDVVTAHLRQAARDERVKAVVLRVESPGGSYIASDTIHREVAQVRATGRPVVASMGTVAASGGYFVAMGADEIVAQPTTLTGSIGVVAGKMITTGLEDKLGFTREGVDAGARAGFLASDRHFTEEEWDLLNTWLDDVYLDFTTKAAAGRKMDLDQLEAVARGRVWTGADAKERRLVDHLGGMRTALARAADLAGLDPSRIRAHRVPERAWMERLKPAQSSEHAAAAGMAATAGTWFGTGPEATLRALAAHAGLPLPYGALSLPWHTTIR